MFMKTKNLTASVSKRRAGRPRAFERDDALDIAMDLFWRHGFDATSTNQLTSAMDISPPSLYAAFGSKEALYREAIAQYQKRYGAFFSEPIGADCSAWDAVERVLLGAAKQFSNPSHAPGCMIACGELQSSADNAFLIAEIAALRQDAQRAIRVRLEAARKVGELPAVTDTGALAAFYAMVIQGMAVQARDGASLARLKRMASLAMHAWPSK